MVEARDSNPAPLACKAGALPVAPRPLGTRGHPGPSPNHGYFTGSVDLRPQEPASAASAPTLRHTHETSGGEEHEGEELLHDFLQQRPHEHRAAEASTAVSEPTLRRSEHWTPPGPPPAGEEAAAQEGAFQRVVAVDAAAAEAGDLAGRVQAGEPARRPAQHPR